MKKKRQFHCEKCGSACDIYKKGKAHRVLVCPQCGVLATNPISRRKVGGALTGAATGATLGSVVPIIGTGIGAAGGAIIGAIASGDEDQSTTSPQSARICKSPRRSLTPFYIERALKA